MLAKQELDAFTHDFVKAIEPYDLDEISCILHIDLPLAALRAATNAQTEGRPTLAPQEVPRLLVGHAHHLVDMRDAGTGIGGIRALYTKANTSSPPPVTISALLPFAATILNSLAQPDATASSAAVLEPAAMHAFAMANAGLPVGVPPPSSVPQ